MLFISLILPFKLCLVFSCVFSDKSLIFFIPTNTLVSDLIFLFIFPKECLYFYDDDDESKASYLLVYSICCRYITSSYLLYLLEMNDG